jgi:predicted porin
MKNVSKLALFVAAGMLSAGANANTIVLGEEGTSLSLSGGFASEYLVRDTVDTSTTASEDNQNDLAGEIELEFEAVRNFENFDAYFEGTFEFATQEEGGTGNDLDGAAAGIEGNFGTLEVGDTDNVYEDLITDALDITEQAGLTYGTRGFDEANMLTYYSPETAGFSFNLQAGIEDEVEGTPDESEQGLIASAAYDFGAGAIHVGYDERGDTADSGD